MKKEKPLSGCSQTSVGEGEAHVLDVSALNFGDAWQPGG